MLIKGYFHYLLNMLSVSWATIPGLLAIACLIASIVAAIYLGKTAANRGLIVYGLLLLSVCMFLGSLYAGVYEIEQPETFVDIAKEFPDDEDCGTAWTDWFPMGAGLTNACGKGCYRGATLRQEVKMVKFPPWPVTRREMQCWVRKPQPLAADAYILED